MTPERQAEAERLLEAGLDDARAAVLALAATQPALALEAFAALSQAVYPYLRGDRRAEGLLLRLQAAEKLLAETQT
jgi:hypothetical protein